MEAKKTDFEHDCMRYAGMSLNKKIDKISKEIVKPQPVLRDSENMGTPEGDG